MWLSKHIAGRKTESGANVGEVTISGSQTAVYTDCEKRSIAIFSPGGYLWRPSPGQKMMILKTKEGRYCALGGEMGIPPEEINDGEVYIKSKNGASVFLKNDGSVVITGKVYINGGLYVNGTEIG